MIKSVLLDMDGLLIDSERYMWIPNETQAAEDVGYPLPMDVVRQFMGGTLDHSNRIAQEYYNGYYPIEAWRKRMWELNYLAVDEGRIPLKKGARELLSFLKEQQIESILATSSPTDFTERILNKLDLYDYFDAIVTANDISHSKPAPDSYLAAHSRCHSDKADAIVLEDSHNGFRAGINGGFRTILVQDLCPWTDEDRKEAYRIFDDLFGVIDLIREENGITDI